MKRNILLLVMLAFSAVIAGIMATQPLPGQYSVFDEVPSPQYIEENPCWDCWPAMARVNELDAQIAARLDLISQLERDIRDLERQMDELRSALIQVLAHGTLEELEMVVMRMEAVQGQIEMKQLSIDIANRVTDDMFVTRQAYMYILSMCTICNPV